MKLELSELEVNPNKREDFKNYLKTLSAPQDVYRFLKEFDKWLANHKDQLQIIFNSINSKTEFVNWARIKYYNWSFNQQVKSIQNEIEELTK